MSEENKSYRQIIKSTSIFGGSQVVTVLISILRNKMLAILLGTFGMGLVGMYQTILEMVKALSSFGIETTGVREIATDKKSYDQTDLSEKIGVINQLSMLFAVLGALVCILFSYPISLWAFGYSTYASQICLLSISVFFSILAAGQNVILHGLREITYMVKSTITWSFLGLVFSLPLYYFFREAGIAPAFIVMSLIMYIVSSYYRNKVQIKGVSLSYRTVLSRASSLLKMGSFILVSSILTSAGYFFIRAFLSRDMGLDSVGLFQAAWSITNVYLMLVLKSMGTDFYPRLCSIIDQRSKARELINEQTYIVLVVSVPLIVLLLLSSKIILVLLYSSEFTGATLVLNWQVLGTFFKVLSWPLGFVLLAKGKGLLFFLSELVFMIVYLAFTYILYSLFSFEAVGIAYLIAYVIYLLLVYVFGRNLCDFAWTLENVKIGFVSLILVLLAFYFAQYHIEYTIIVGVPLFVISLIYSFVKLNKVFPIKSISDIFRKK